MSKILASRVAAAAVGFAALSAPALAAAPVAEVLVTGSVDATKMTAVENSRPRGALHAQDAGELAASTQLEHLQLVMRRSSSRQAALDALVAEQLDPKSANFHKWLTAEEIGTRFGPSQADIETTKSWLASQGLVVNKVALTGMSIDFTGSARAVAAAFHAPVHAMVSADGTRHIANVTEVSIPTALTPVVRGVSLSNFFPRPMIKPVGEVKHAPGGSGAFVVSKPAPGFVGTIAGNTYQAVTPQDLFVIYNLLPLQHNSPFIGPTGAPLPINGNGTTIINAEQTNILPGDVATFRKTFGLDSYKGTLTLEHPGGCGDPGFIADEGESALDAEWSGTAAPNAHVIQASCPLTSTQFGVMTALQNTLEKGPAGNVISVSYGGCEQFNGFTFNAMWYDLVEQGAAQGIGIFVSTGDEMVAGCDNPNTEVVATYGLAVNSLASPPYDTAVGGTDFYDAALGEVSKFWNAKNNVYGQTARSYIPEIPWNDSCASAILRNFRSKGASPTAYCNSADGLNFVNIVGGSGGASGLYEKPSWQSGVPGIPDDGARDLPDVSLFASNGIWGHFYLYCMSDASQGGVPCDYSNEHDFNFSAAGGTSFSAPIMAGIQALVVQANGGNVGNAAPRLYQMAAQQFSFPLLAKNCDSTLGTAISSQCVYNDVTRGDIATPCQAGTPNCYADKSSTSSVGILSSSLTGLRTAYPTKKGYDLATGLGTLNVTNYVVNYVNY